MKSVTFRDDAGAYSFGVFEDKIVYALDNLIKVINEDSLTLLYQINFPTLVDDVQMSFPFLLILSNNSLCQYDLNLKIKISCFEFFTQTLNWKILPLSDDLFHAYQPFPIALSDLRTYKMNLEYPLLNEIQCL